MDSLFTYMIYFSNSSGQQQQNGGHYASTNAITSNNGALNVASLNMFNTNTNANTYHQNHLLSQQQQQQQQFHHSNSVYGTDQIHAASLNVNNMSNGVNSATNSHLFQQQMDVGSSVGGVVSNDYYASGAGSLSNGLSHLSHLNNHHSNANFMQQQPQQYTQQYMNPQQQQQQQQQQSMSSSYHQLAPPPHLNHSHLQQQQQQQPQMWNLPQIGLHNTLDHQQTSASDIELYAAAAVVNSNGGLNFSAQNGQQNANANSLLSRFNATGGGLYANSMQQQQQQQHQQPGLGNTKV